MMSSGGNDQRLRDSSLDDSLVIGVDGGGTKTTAWLGTLAAAHSSEILGRGSAGPANPCSVGRSQATRAVAAAIGAAFANAGLDPRPVAAACFSIAGTSPPAEREAFAAWARQAGVARRIEMSTDAAPILACLDCDCGVALIAGTGSFALGRAANGDLQRAGGWGYRFGDEGSAYAIATAALAAAFRAADGRGPGAELLDRFLGKFSVRAPRDLVSCLYADQMDRRQIADLAPLVAEAAEAGDRVAVAVLQDAANGLADLVLTLQQRLQLASPLALAVTGGVLVGNERVRRLVIDRLAAESVETRLVVVPEPVAGAVMLARRAVDGG